MRLTAPAREFLLGVAARSIHHGFAGGEPGSPALAEGPPEAFEPRACFVTLTTTAGELRGCRGMLEPREALATDVWCNAWASAFDDPRFAPVTAAEFADLRIEISVLGPLETVPVASERELHALLRPREDGVVLAWRGRRATFLPQVWEDVADVRDFLAHLKVKAGLAPDFWAPDVAVWRYGIESVAGGTGRQPALQRGEALGERR